MARLVILEATLCLPNAMQSSLNEWLNGELRLGLIPVHRTFAAVVTVSVTAPQKVLNA